LNEQHIAFSSPVFGTQQACVQTQLQIYTAA